MGSSHHRPCPTRRAHFGDLRRLPNLGPDGGGSKWHRRTTWHIRRTGPTGCHHRDVPPQAHLTDPNALEGLELSGYEIHVGVTERSAQTPAFARIWNRDGVSESAEDGAQSTDGRIMGTYLHGLFDTAATTHAFLSRLRPDLELEPPRRAGCNGREDQYDALADHLRAALDMPRLLSLIQT